MDYDRRSAVSSFYGARKSTDVLDSTASPPLDPPRRPRTDSGAASSFYNPNRASRAGTEYGGGTANAGYNRTSYFYQGREEPVKGGEDEEHSMLSKPDDGFDIYADFNNVGPRYSAAFGKQDTGYALSYSTQECSRLSCSQLSPGALARPTAIAAQRRRAVHPEGCGAGHSSSSWPGMEEVRAP